MFKYRTQHIYKLNIFQDMHGCTGNVDYFLWPRNDIERIECVMFSKWKDEIGPYKRIEVG